MGRLLVDVQEMLRMVAPPRYVATVFRVASASAARPVSAEAADPARYPAGMTDRPRDHRHLFTVHRHPGWLGHSDPDKRGYKPADTWHAHLFWKHHHGPEPLAHDLWHWFAWALTWFAAILAFVQILKAL